MSTAEGIAALEKARAFRAQGDPKRALKVLDLAITGLAVASDVEALRAIADEARRHSDRSNAAWSTNTAEWVAQEARGACASIASAEDKAGGAQRMARPPLTTAGPGFPFNKQVVCSR